MVKIAVYLRMSLDREQGIERQREDCNVLLARRGWTGTEYVDNARSATRGIRPAYQRMLKDIEAGEIDMIVAWHPDRLYRKLADLLPLIELCDEHGVAIATHQAGDIDLTTDAGRLQAKILGAVAENEGERRTARQKRALLQRAQSGAGWGSRAFGYTLHDSLEPLEAQAVKSAYESVLGGATLGGIARSWNAAGLVTARGGNQWVGSTVRAVLLNPRYAGIRKFHDQQFPAVWPAIVPEDVWLATASVLKDPSRRGRGGGVRRHLMTGLILCGACQKPMGVGTSHDRNRTPGIPLRKVYLCKAEGCRRLARDLAKINGLVEETMVARLSRDDAAELMVKRDNTDLPALRKRAEEIEAQIIDLADAYRVGWTIEQIGRATLGLQEELAVVKAKMVDANDQRLFAGVIGADDVLAAWRGVDLDRQRAMISRLVVFTVNRTKRGRGWHPEHIGIRWLEPH